MILKHNIVEVIFLKILFIYLFFLILIFFKIWYTNFVNLVAIGTKSYLKMWDWFLNWALVVIQPVYTQHTLLHGIFYPLFSGCWWSGLPTNLHPATNNRLCFCWEHYRVPLGKNHLKRWLLVGVRLPCDAR